MAQEDYAGTDDSVPNDAEHEDEGGENALRANHYFRKTNATNKETKTKKRKLLVHGGLLRKAAFP